MNPSTSSGLRGIELPGRFNTHCHLRDDSPEDMGLLSHTARIQAAHFDWCVAMPNTSKPILTAEDALRYLDRIKRYAPGLGVILVNFLTLQTTRQMVREAAKAGVKAYKLYIGGATTNSARGVPVDKVEDCDDVLDEMAAQRVRLLIHLEDPRVPSFRMRESAAIPLLRRMAERHPDLIIVIEHISCAETIKEFLPYPNVWMGVTPHHLRLTEDMALGMADYLCMPVVKTPADREALEMLFSSGHERVVIGLDDAPHTIHRKRNHPPGEKPPSGIWCVEAALPVYADILESYRAIHRMPDLIWNNAVKLYGIPAMSGRPVKVVIRTEEDPAKPQPFLAGEEFTWGVEEVSSAG